MLQEAETADGIEFVGMSFLSLWYVFPCHSYHTHTSTPAFTHTSTHALALSVSILLPFSCTAHVHLYPVAKLCCVCV